MRARAREVAIRLIDELGERAAKLTFAELTKGIEDAATRGGCLTDKEHVELDGMRMDALARTLDRAALTTEQRSQILDDYQSHLKALAEAT